MARATRLLGATSVAGLSLSVWFYLDNRALRDQLAQQGPAAVAPVAAIAPTARPVPAPPPRTTPVSQPSGPATVTPPPSLPPTPPPETRMDRRARRTEELAQLLGRLDGESEEEYRARILPLISGGLLVPRARADEQRKVAEEKARVTPEQSARLDKAFDKIYGDVLDYTNKAVADGQLSPYERNVAGWLEFAGGLGGILNDANGQIGKILEPSQVRAMSSAGFEWGEYLGLKAPWEQLKAPPLRAP
jgi:hypothetical protein